jgi:hypothetical protein
MALPRARQSTQAIVNGHCVLASEIFAIRSSRFATRSFSSQIQDPGARDPLQGELDLQDVARQAHAAERGAEEVGLALLGHFEDAVVGETHAQRTEMLAEAARAMVVLAVYVGGHHAAQRHRLGPGRDRARPAPGQEQILELREREAGLRAQHAARRVEREQPIGEPRARQRLPGRRRQSRVPVGAAQAPGEACPARGRLQVFGEDLPPLDDRIATPTLDLHCLGPSCRRGSQGSRGCSAPRWRESGLPARR